MTKAAIKQAFRRLDSVEQAAMLRDLAAALEESLHDANKADARTFAERQHEEVAARPWREVRSKIKGARKKRRSPE